MRQDDTVILIGWAERLDHETDVVVLVEQLVDDARW